MEMIRLLKGTKNFIKGKDYRKMEQGDVVLGEFSEELAVWTGEEGKALAKEELKKYKCTYERDGGGCHKITEYALEYSEVDEEGEFQYGCDYDLADGIMPPEEALELAYYLRYLCGGEWDMDACAELCEMASMEKEWNAADSESFEAVVYAAAEKLGVEV